MIVLRFLDAVSQGIGICWIIAVLKAAIVYVGRVTEVAFLAACRTPASGISIPRVRRMQPTRTQLDKALSPR